jgi:trigger factor
LSSKDKVTQYDIKVDDETLADRIKNLRKSYGKMSNPDVSAEDDVLYAELKQFLRMVLFLKEVLSIQVLSV